MYDGKKGVAQKIVYGAFDIIAEKTGNNPLEVFEQAMENVMPVLEVRLAVSAAQLTRFLWRFAPKDARHSDFVGFQLIQEPAVKRQ